MKTSPNDENVTMTRLEYISLTSERDAYRDLTNRMRDYFSRKCPDHFKSFTMLENVLLSEHSKSIVRGKPS